MYVQAHGSILFENCTFANGGHEAAVGGAIALHNAAAEVPGLRQATEAGDIYLTLKSCTFRGNRGTRGGALWVENY